jgi:hypothetical protein
VLLEGYAEGRLGGSGGGSQILGWLIHRLSAKSDFYTKFASRDLTSVITIGQYCLIRAIRSIMICRAASAPSVTPLHRLLSPFGSGRLPGRRGRGLADFAAAPATNLSASPARRGQGRRSAPCTAATRIGRRRIAIPSGRRSTDPEPSESKRQSANQGGHSSSRDNPVGCFTAMTRPSGHSLRRPDLASGGLVQISRC